MRERGVRLVFDGEGQHGSRWQAIVSIAAKADLRRAADRSFHPL